jgi:hypothetical protein
VAYDGSGEGSCCGIQGEAGGAGNDPAPASTTAPFSPSAAREQLQRQAIGEGRLPRHPPSGDREGAVLGEGVQRAGGGRGVGRGILRGGLDRKMARELRGRDIARQLER